MDTNKKALLLKADGTAEQVRPKNGKTFSLKELQGFVGGYVQLIVFPTKMQLWINEEGKNEGLPLNKTATSIWRQIYNGYEVGADDFVVGDCLICDPELTD